MIGPRKAVSIREQLRRVLSDAANETKQALGTQTPVSAGASGHEVLDSIERILKSGKKRTKRRPAPTAE